MIRRRLWKILVLMILAALLCLVVLCSSIAKAQSVTIITPLSCGLTKDFIPPLETKFKEKVRGQGITPRGSIVRLYISPKTWTIVRTMPSGLSCTLDAGDNWETVPPEIPGEKS